MLASCLLAERNSSHCTRPPLYKKPALAHDSRIFFLYSVFYKQGIWYMRKYTNSTDDYHPMCAVAYWGKIQHKSCIGLWPSLNKIQVWTKPLDLHISEQYQKSKPRLWSRFCKWHCLYKVKARISYSMSAIHIGSGDRSEGCDLSFLLTLTGLVIQISVDLYKDYVFLPFSDKTYDFLITQSIYTHALEVEEAL